MVTAAIVLAAGASTRMGANKMLLELHGEPIVHRAARVALEAKLDPVIVVLGRDADTVRHAVLDLPVRIAFNPQFAGPTVTSVQRGLDQLDPSCDAIVVLLADMVGVDPAMLRALQTAVARDGTLAAASRYGPIVAPPHAFRRVLFDELRAEIGPSAGRAVIERHRDQVRFLDWSPERNVDIDTPADYDAAQHERRSGG